MTNKCPFQFDLMNPQTFHKQMPFELFKRLRENFPVSLQSGCNEQDDFWAITDRDDIDFISKNPQLFSSRENLAHPSPGGEITQNEESLAVIRQMIINMDPPEHLKFRRVVKNAFTAKAVDELEPHMRETAKRIIDAVASKGQCEFVTEVAAEMPLFVICTLMNMPMQRRKRFAELVDIMFALDDPEENVGHEEGHQASAEIFAIALELAANHRENPQTGTVIDALLNGSIEGEALNEFEFCVFFLILIIGAVETIRTALSQGFRLLIAHPDQLQLLIDDPSLIPDAIEEILRYFPPLTHMQRTAMQDITVGGQTIKQGEILRMFYPAANHDPAIFGEDADQFDILRGTRMKDLKSQHRAFGIGQHFCIGSHLARKELLTMFEEIIPRLRNPKLSEEPSYLHSNFVMAIKKMPVSFTAEH